MENEEKDFFDRKFEEVLQNITILQTEIEDLFGRIDGRFFDLEEQIICSNDVLRTIKEIANRLNLSESEIQICLDK